MTHKSHTKLEPKCGARYADQHMRVLQLTMVLLAGCSAQRAKTPLRSLANASCAREVRTDTQLRLITREEYQNSILDLFGESAKVVVSLPADTMTQGFDNDALSRQVTDDHLARYLQTAEALVARVARMDRARLFFCEPVNASCVDALVNTWGKRLYRRALFEDEFKALRIVVERTSNPESGVLLLLQTLLQSPQFLYVDGLASELSFMLWAGPPDEALIDAENRGELSNQELFAAHLGRMQRDPKAARGKKRFFSLWLEQARIKALEKDAATYPDWNTEEAQRVSDELEDFVESVISKGGDLYSLLTHTAAQKDAGVLGQPGFLALHAAPTRSAPVRRGLFVLNKLLCDAPPPPPQDASLLLPPQTNGHTTRDRFAAHSQGSCKGCHARIDGIGFTFEHYDGVGSYRALDNGQKVNASGAIVDQRDAALNGAVEGITELAHKLAASGQVSDCVAAQWYRYAVARPLDAADDCALAAVQVDFAKAGGNFDALLGSLASHLVAVER